MDLVREYVADSLPPAKRGQERTLFLEPRLESGFPDVVVVYWTPSTTAAWSDSRAELTKDDLRVLHYLSFSNPMPEAELVGLFGARVKSAIRRLTAADVLIVSRRGIRARSLRQNYAVRRLIAIEAKIDSWRKGLRQAAQNVWFASESYLLVPTVPRVPELLEAADRLAVGVLVRGQHLKHATRVAPRQFIPRSYASWLFNEWVWKRSRGFTEIE